MQFEIIIVSMLWFVQVIGILGQFAITMLTENGIRWIEDEEKKALFTKTGFPVYDLLLQMNSSVERSSRSHGQYMVSFQAYRATVSRVFKLLPLAYLHHNGSFQRVQPNENIQVESRDALLFFLPSSNKPVAIPSVELSITIFRGEYDAQALMKQLNGWTILHCRVS